MTQTQPTELVAGRLDGRLLDALRTRRSRRLGHGMTLNGGPLAFSSSAPPQPLTEEETAVLVFAAAGLTGGVLADWDWSEQAGGNMLANVVGRTVGSADAAHLAALFVINDDGAWLMPRPCDLAPAVARQAAAAAAAGDYVRAWRLTRIKITERRPHPPLEFPYNISGNRWSAYAPGTTTFLPVVENTFLMINVLLELLSERSGATLLDDGNMFRPAGLRRFAKSKGGHLEDDPRALKALPIMYGDRTVEEMGCIEIGAMIQNLYLAAEVMGLGGFAHYAQADFGDAGQSWFDQLGFTMVETPMSRLFNVPRPASWILKAKRADVPLRTPVGLEVDGQVVLKSYRPPCFPTMADAVQAVIDHKLGPAGTYRTGVVEGRWQRPDEFAAGVAPISQAGHEASVAYCEYVWDRYGRFPVYALPFHTLLAFQVAHLDLEFYARHYQQDSLTPAHHRHQDTWHG
jgi:hypothetical protein